MTRIPLVAERWWPCVGQVVQNGRFDAVLADAAVEACAEFADGTSVVGLLRDDGTVRVVCYRGGAEQ